MIIEQSKEQRQRAVALHTRTYVRSFRLAQSKVWSRPRIRSNEKLPDVKFDMNYKPVASRIGADCLILDTDFVFAVLAEPFFEESIEESKEESQESKENELILMVECRFEAEYGFIADYRPNEDEIEAFHSANAVFNCWPYFREYVQNAAVRMDFPAPPIPFLRIVGKPEEKQLHQGAVPKEKPRRRVRVLRRPKKELSRSKAD